VRECVLGRRRGPAQSRQRPGVQTQGVTHVVKTEAMGELGIEQTNHVTPGTERAA
jgi:hypothetical protein